jgi:hypothetical protein
MRFFSLIDFQYIVLAFFLGLVGLILVYMAWGSYPTHRRRESKEEMRELYGHEIESGHDAEKAPIAPFIVFVYVGIIVWSIVYMIITGIVRAVAY